MSNDIDTNNEGFTIIELLIAMALIGVIVGSMFSFSIAQRKYFAVQEEISEMVQNTRAAMEMISSELTMAGYSPSGYCVFWDPIPCFTATNIC